MFSGCSSIQKINLSNFNCDNVNNMLRTFEGCSSLNELELYNFKTNNVIYMYNMFSGCNDKLKNMIRIKNTNIKEEAFL
jgi:surface protein